MVGGPGAALAVMDGAGRVPAGHRRRPRPATPLVAAFDAVWPRADVTLVELGDPAASDAVLGQLLERVDPARDLVMVVAPAAPDDAAELTVFAIAGPGIDPGRARSATTRRDGYVTLPDVGVTVLDALGVDGARRHERHRDHLRRRPGLRRRHGRTSWPTPTPSPCSATAPWDR